jgi:hypothetical protein
VTAASSDLRAWLAQLTDTHTAATPGEWKAEPNYRLEKGCRCLSCWEAIEGSWDIDPVDGPDCLEHDCWHNISIGEADAAAIVAEHNAMPVLLGIVGGLLDLADELEHEARDIDIDANAAVVLWDAETRLRAVVAAAIEGAGQ